MVMYLVTKKIGGNSPHERVLCETKDVALSKALELSEFRAPSDLSEWRRRQGNQHKPTRWWFPYQARDRQLNVYIRAMRPVEDGGA